MFSRRTSNKLGDAKLFFRYVIPSMISMVTAGVYTLVDGLFVGWGAGAEALAALNVAFPAAILIIAIGEMIGTGTSIVISMSRGRAHTRTPDRLFGNMIALLIPAGILLPLILLPSGRFLLGMMGADETLMGMALQYWQIVVGGSIFMLTTIGLLAAMRNDKAPGMAMMILVAGLIANIILDYLFVIVWKQGVAGSAWATILSQMICCGFAVWYFAAGKSRLKFGLRHLKLRRMTLIKSLFSGLPSFGIQISVAVVILLHNRQTLAYGGVNAVAAYAVVSYVESTILMLLQGIALGIQPVVSYLHGAGEPKRRHRMAWYALAFSLAVGCGGTLLSAFGRNLIPEMFNLHGEIFQMTSLALLITAAVYPLMGFLQVSESYFQSMGRHTASSFLIYTDAFAVLPLCLILLPLFWGLNGVWLAMPLSKLVMAFLAAGLWKHRKPMEKITEKRPSAVKVFPVLQKKLIRD